MRTTYLTPREAGILNTIAHDSKMDWFHLVWVNDSGYLIYDRDEEQIVPFFDGLQTLDEGLDYEFVEESIGACYMEIYSNLYRRIQETHDNAFFEIAKKTIDKMKKL
jgi:hypothetical protein